MATYKLMQDIEAEDHILGPLTLRQFIFAMIAVFLIYICFILVVKHIFFLLVLFLPPALFFGFFALPFGRDQPTEVWFLAKLRFWFKPRRRVWNQSGIKEFVTITVPKKVERVLTKGLSQTEVSSRLQVLAQTLDSRGWAVKHVDTDVYSPTFTSDDSDRLINLESLPQEVPAGDVTPVDDMLDTATNPIARQFDTMINRSSQVRRQELMSRMSGAITPPSSPPAGSGSSDSWFVSQPVTSIPTAVVTTPSSEVSADESALSAQLAARANSRHVSFGNLRTVQPMGAPTAPMPDPPAAVPAATDGQAATVTVSDDPGILSLARNDDLNVATLARQAKKNRPTASQTPDEVVIPLH